MGCGDAVDEDGRTNVVQKNCEERVHTVPEVALIGGVIQPIPGALHSTAVE